MIKFPERVFETSQCRRAAVFTLVSNIMVNSIDKYFILILEGNLPSGTREKDLERFFKGYGRKMDILIKQVQIYTDYTILWHIKSVKHINKYSKPTQGFGFVEG